MYLLAVPTVVHHTTSETSIEHRELNGDHEATDRHCSSCELIRPAPREKTNHGAVHAWRETICAHISFVLGLERNESIFSSSSAHRVPQVLRLCILRIERLEAEIVCEG